MKDYQIGGHLQNNNRIITEAAYSLLLEWRVSQTDKKTAYINLCDALRRVRMPYLINELEQSS